jgi:hypothetical protein
VTIPINILVVISLSQSSVLGKENIGCCVLTSFSGVILGIVEAFSFEVALISNLGDHVDQLMEDGPTLLELITPNLEAEGTHSDVGIGKPVLRAISSSTPPARRNECHDVTASAL